jgi:putative transposase
MAEVVKIRQTTREIMRSFKRSDVRIRRKLARKYWKRASHRTDQILHAATNFIVEDASRNRAALALEDLTGIGKMYRRGNGQGKDYRFRLNSWPHWKENRMLEYKAAWKGVTVIPLTKSETYGSSSICSACGEKLHDPVRGDVEHWRMLWCPNCRVWVDRDMIGTLNLSNRGRSRFDRSLSRSETEESRSQAAASIPPIEEKGLAGEAMKGNGTKTLVVCEQVPY